MTLQRYLLFFYCLCFFAGLADPSNAGLIPVNLRCDGQVDPLGAAPMPELSWRVESPERGAAQEAWQILVASSAQRLSDGVGDLWDSGKVVASRLPHVVYGGKPVAPGQHCYWKVRCWGGAEDSPVWSDVAVWEVAPVTPADWQGARWIDDGKPPPTSDEAFYQPDPAPLMRRQFKLVKPVHRARLHVVGLGWCIPTLNGDRVGDHRLDPPWTAFEKRILFSTHDVTKQLANGENCLGLELGNGWFNPLPLRMWGRRNIRESVAIGRPRAIVCLIVDHPDGTQTKVVSGPEWSWCSGPTLSNSVYLGEVRDARLALADWNKVDFDASTWKPVRVYDASLEPLQPLKMPPVRAGESITAVAVTTPKPDVHIVDFGQNFTGVPEICLNAPAGTKIQFRYGELLNSDGSLNPLTSVCGQIKGTRKQDDGNEVSIGGPGAPAIAWQQDVYICRGDGVENYRPKFTFHGFRFMEVTGLSEPPSAIDCQAIPLRTDLAAAGTFSCSHERLNEIQQMCLRTFLANVVSVQSDCPHRERFGYGGDIAATSEAFLMNFDMAGFYAKTVRDWADGQRPDGNLTDTAPFVGVNYCGVGWAMVHPLLLEQLYQHYGNRSLLDEQLPVAIRWLEIEASARKNGLVVKGLGDHEALNKSGGAVITTPMFVDAARRVARLSRLVGRDTDALRFEAMANESATAWAKSFLTLDTGKVGDGSQTGQVLALGFAATPDAARPVVFDRLVEALVTPDGPRLTTGIFGTRMLLEALSREGRSDLAYALAVRKTFPSWGWMLENQATTLWEHWAGSDGTFSNNHPMFGSISAWFFRWLGGIQVADDAVGADRILIRPQIVAGLEWVKCSHRTVRGLVESNWTAKPGVMEFEIVIPPDTSALVELPVKSGDRITEGGLSLDQATGIEVFGLGSQLKLGSGSYHFTINLTNQKRN